MTSQGQLERFDLVPVSAPCVSWSGTTLTVQQPYGWVLPPAGEFLWNGTAFHYSTVVPGELGLVLTTVESSPASFDPSIPITPNPPRSLASAWVIPAGRSESIRMGVTQALASLIPLGVRGLTDRETVVDVRDAPWTRDLADASAQALTLATPHHTVSVDPAPASTEGYAEGHTWVQVASATDETVQAMWRATSGVWVSVPVDEPLVAPMADIGVIRVALLIAEAIRAGMLTLGDFSQSISLSPVGLGLDGPALEFLNHYAHTSLYSGSSPDSFTIASRTHLDKCAVFTRTVTPESGASWEVEVWDIFDGNKAIGLDHLGPYLKRQDGVRRAIASIDDTNWAALTLSAGVTGWIDCRTLNGVTYVRGQVSRVWAGTNAAGTLPAAFRPPRNTSLSVALGTGGTMAVVRATGVIDIIATTAHSNAVTISGSWPVN